MVENCPMMLHYLCLAILCASVLILSLTSLLTARYNYIGLGSIDISNNIKKNIHEDRSSLLKQKNDMQSPLSIYISVIR